MPGDPARSKLLFSNYRRKLEVVRHNSVLHIATLRCLIQSLPLIKCLC